MSYEHLLREHFHTLGRSAYIPEENVTADGMEEKAARGAIDGSFGNATGGNAVGNVDESADRSADGSSLENATGSTGGSAVRNVAGQIINCSFGVNPFGYSQRIDKRSLIERSDISNYPPFPYNELKDAIIQFWAGVQLLDRSNIRVCSGTMLILNYLNVLFLERGDRVLGYAPQFPEYVRSVRVHGGVYDGVPLRSEDQFTFCPEAVVEQLGRESYKLVYIDNPNNPTGQIIPLRDVEIVVQEAQRRGVCVIVDEAYGEYMSRENSAISLLDSYDNLFVTRSFSKGYALASLRIGYVVASEELSSYYSLVDDLLLNPIGLEAAIVSLRDEEFLAETVARTQEVKREVLGALRQFRVLTTDDSVPIFALEHPDKSVDLQALLRSYGVLATGGLEGLGRNAVRIRIPADAGTLIGVLRFVEEPLLE